MKWRVRRKTLWSTQSTSPPQRARPTWNRNLHPEPSPKSIPNDTRCQDYGGTESWRACLSKNWDKQAFAKDALDVALRQYDSLANTLGEVLQGCVSAAMIHKRADLF